MQINIVIMNAIKCSMLISSDVNQQLVLKTFKRAMPDELLYMQVKCKRMVQHTVTHAAEEDK